MPGQVSCESCKAELLYSKKCGRAHLRSRILKCVSENELSKICMVLCVGKVRMYIV